MRSRRLAPWGMAIRRVGSRLALVLTLGMCGCSHQAAETPTRGRLLVAVAESHAALLQREADLFNSLYSEARVEIRPLRTREAFVALAGDSVRMIAVDRVANQEEEAAQAPGGGWSEVRWGEDALGFFVHEANGIHGLQVSQLADVLSGRVRRWDDLPGAALSGPIRVVLTGRNSGAWELLSTRFFPGLVAAASRIVDSEAEVLRAIAADPNAIGVASIASWKNPPPGAALRPASAGEPGWAAGVAAAAHPTVRALEVVVPDSLGTWVAHPLHQANVQRGKYPFHYPVTMIFDAHSPLAAGFASFVASAPGQKLVLDAGLVPATMPVRLVTLRP